jgi:hypothetical protein
VLFGHTVLAVGSARLLTAARAAVTVVLIWLSLVAVRLPERPGLPARPRLRTSPRGPERPSPRRTAFTPVGRRAPPRIRRPVPII